MASNAHTFVGAMDLDSPSEVIGKGFVRMARNCIPRGVPPNMRYESRPGTTAVPNSFLPAGTNLSIFSGYDANNARILDFNYNSNGNHGIYIYNTISGIWQRLIQDGTNTSGVVLGFTATSRIHSFDIIYQDDNKGDLLFFVDSLKRPTKINIDRFLGNAPFAPYNPTKRPYIEVIKAPPVEPPHVTYENDNTVQANNLRNTLFQFAYTFIYDDLEESVVGTGSIVPLPVNPFSNVINIPVTQDARISLYLQTGDVNVAKIKIYMRSVQNSNQFGAWQIVDTIDKTVGSVASNTYYRYLFYNSGNYAVADPLFVVLPFDSVPLQTNAQALANGNTLLYGGLTEGYNWLKGSFGTNIAPTELPNYTVNGALFFGDFNGTFTGLQPNVELFLTGAGTNNGFGFPNSLTNTFFEFVVLATSGVTNIGFTYVNAGSTTNIPTLLAAIAAQAVAAGWVLATTNSNSIVIYYPTGTITFEDAQANSSNVSPTNVSYAFYPNATYSFGVVYFDAGGRTNGVITGATGNVNTLPYVPNSGSIATQIQLTINQVPPAWAVYYRVVRTDNLTYNKFTQWISNQAFSNFNQLVTNQYAYIGISNMQDYNQSLEANSQQSAQTVVSYEFTQGDRITIQGRYAVDGTFAPLNFDYPVLGLVVDPIINGVAQKGSFIQIAYPAGDISGTFAFDNTPDFQDYLFTVYSISKTNKNADPNTGSNEQSGNVYYETGLTFGIGNAGTNAAYHFGNIADNVVGMTDGDIFCRTRNVPIGQTYYLNGGPENESGSLGGGFFLARITPANPTQAAPIPQVVTSQYAIGTQSFVSGGGPLVNIINPTDPPYNPFPTSEGFFYYNRSSSPQTIRIRTQFTVNVTAETNMGVYLKIMTSGTVQGLALLQATEGMIPNSTTGYLVNIDGTATVPPNGQVYWVFRNNNHAGAGTPHLIISQYILRLDVVDTIALQIFDQSYSDIFQLVENADNRPSVENTEALQTFYSGLGRFSQPNELDTDLNNANRFYPNNTFNVDKQFGEIVRMVVNGRNIVFFQYLRVCTCGVYGQYIKTKNGSTQLITTDKIIDSDNLEYYEGDNGIGNAADSLAIDGFRVYFADPVKGFLCRLSKDGIIRISLLYKVQTFVGQTVPLYLNNSGYNYQFGGNPNILGCFNFVDTRDSETIFVFQGGTSGAGNIGGQSLAFSEDRNAWHDFYDFVPDSIVCAGNTLYSFFNGVMHIHNNATNYCNYYGVQYQPSITIVFNDAVGFKKTWIAVSELASGVWNCPSITTQIMSFGATPQASNLVDSDFKLLEGKYEAAFYNDTNSIGGLINGDSLKGTYIIIQFTVTNGQNFSWLMSPVIKFIDSPLTTK